MTRSASPLPTYETARLLHRPLTPDDLPWLAQLYADPRVMRFLGKGTTRSWGETAQTLDSMLHDYAEHGLGLYATVLKTTGRAIGRCGYIQWPQDAGGNLELAWALDPVEWGQGYATEAAEMFARLVWKLRPVDNVVSYIRPLNAPSIRVAEKIGMHRWKMQDRIGAPACVYRLDRPKD